MKKYLLFLLVLCTVLSLCLGCVGNADSLGGSKDDTGNQSNESSEELSSGEESADIGSSAEANDSSEDTETTENPVSSEDDSNFTKEEAIAYFTPETVQKFESTLSYLDLAYNDGVGLNLPFEEFVKWIEGTSEIVFTLPWGSYSIYDYLGSDYCKSFAETTFYGVRINGEETNFYSDVVNNYGQSRDNEISSIEYGINYVYREPGQERGYDKINCHVERLFESDPNYRATFGSISEYYQSLGIKHPDKELTMAKIFDQATDKYYDIEVLYEKTVVSFIFNKLVFEIRFYNREDSFEITDDILNNIVIMDLLEEYEKIK